jgi:HEAT repeat protein
VVLFKEARLRRAAGKLFHSDTWQRQLAARKLGNLGDPRAVEPLMNALGDEEGQVRKAASAALAKLGQCKWQVWVRGDKNDFLRLGESKDPEAIEWLIKRLEDKRWEMRSIAAVVLGKASDPRAVEILIACLENDDTRYIAADVLARAERLGLATTEPLLDTLRSTDKYVRLAAAWAMAEVHDPRVEQVLCGALRHSDPAVIAGAYSFLICRGDPESEDHLIQALYEEGYRSMAEDFAECGNEHLRNAALIWADKNPERIRIQTFRPFPRRRPRWHSRSKTQSPTQTTAGTVDIDLAEFLYWSD